MGFGKLLEKKMKLKGYNQAKLSSVTGIPKTTLSSMISRDISKIEIELFLKICEALDCNPEDFYNEYSKTQRQSIPPSFVMKYNAIDDHGKELLSLILDKEFERCTAEDDHSYHYEAAGVAAAEGEHLTVAVDPEKIAEDIRRLKEQDD